MPASGPSWLAYLTLSYISPLRGWAALPYIIQAFWLPALFGLPGLLQLIPLSALSLLRRTLAGPLAGRGMAVGKGQTDKPRRENLHMESLFSGY